jgi:hypothetical protein
LLGVGVAPRREKKREVAEWRRGIVLYTGQKLA